jgi:hypothetical protein
LKILVLTTSRRDTAEVSIARALEGAHEVTSFNYERRRSITSRPGFHRLNNLLFTGLKAMKKPITYFADRELLRWVKGRKFDLVVIVTVNIVPPEVVAEVKRAGDRLVHRPRAEPGGSRVCLRALPSHLLQGQDRRRPLP